VSTKAVAAESNSVKARIAARQARVGIIGMGYVGLPLALLYSDEFTVTGYSFAFHER
jgi:UDP-N-acetyl-D-glucosamine dehydrogenase